MARKISSQTRCIGILTSGGDCPGLNAAIRGVAKAAIGRHNMRVIGFLDGFRGLAENRVIELDDRAVSGILTSGGTILGTSRDKLAKMKIGQEKLDMAGVAAENLKRHHVDCLVCLGGGGTLKNAMHLHTTTGIDVITLPKTIDNDVAGTDISFGFDSAMNIATEALDRLHTTATSHHRIIVCEIMGHNAGWLALGSGIAGGADIILIPEIPYDLEKVAEHLLERRRHGKRFSIVAVAEGALSVKEAREEIRRLAKEKEQEKMQERVKKGSEAQVKKAKNQPDLEEIHLVAEPKSSRIARQLQQLTGTEARVTTLGHVQRGGPPSPYDRLLCSVLGTHAADLIANHEYNVMVGIHNEKPVPVPIGEIVGKKKLVPANHPWVTAACNTGAFLGN
jgi:6-phosphofructokinase 1